MYTRIVIGNRAETHPVKLSEVRHGSYIYFDKNQGDFSSVDLVLCLHFDHGWSLINLNNDKMVVVDRKWANKSVHLVREVHILQPRINDLPRDQIC